MDDLFYIQYRLAVLGVVCWVACFAIAQSIAIVYRKKFDSIIEKGQLVLFGLSGPGFLFITKNLMKPLFCYENAEGLLRLAAERSVECWSPKHLNYCTISLCCLCAYLPSATLTNAIKFSDGEDVRFVYLFLRLELLLKGMMVFLSLETQNNELLSLCFLIAGSSSIVMTVYYMKPCNIKHINRLTYLIHACATWACAVCIVVTVSG